jgi:hypothetical protein
MPWCQNLALSLSDFFFFPAVPRDDKEERNKCDGQKLPPQNVFVVVFLSDRNDDVHPAIFIRVTVYPGDA